MISDSYFCLVLDVVVGVASGVAIMESFSFFPGRLCGQQPSGQETVYVD